MSVNFILDGYNLIKSRESYFPGNLRQSREKLIDLIKTRRPQGSARNKISIIFDGRPGVSSPRCKEVKVVYTRGLEADQYIEREALKSPNPSSVIAVTDDRGLRKKVREAGADVMGLDDFMEKLFPLKKEKTKKSADPKNISPVEKKKINRELFKKWAGGDLNE